MPYERRQDKIPPTGKITLRLQTEQRDLFTSSTDVAQSVRHHLLRAPVREGKLNLRVTLSELDTLILAAARVPRPQGEAGRKLDALIDYLEDMSARFEDEQD